MIGHITPDTDSVCSAIGYAHFKNLTDKRFIFTPARAGHINEETKFVLEKFNVPVPLEVESLSPTVNNLELHKPIAGRVDISDAPINIDIFLKTLDGRVLANAGQSDTLKGAVLIY